MPILWLMSDDNFGTLSDLQLILAETRDFLPGGARRLTASIGMLDWSTTVSTTQSISVQHGETEGLAEHETTQAKPSK